MNTVALVMPVYQGTAPFVAEHLRRFRSYLGRPFRLIVIDDATQDGTFAQLERLAAESQELTLLRNEERQGWGLGIYYNTARGLKLALEENARWILRLDHDSLLLGSGLAEAVEEVLEADRKIGLLGSLRPSPRIAYIWHTRIPLAVQRSAQRNGFLTAMHGLVWTACSGGVVFRRELIEAWAERGWLEHPPLRRWLGGVQAIVDDNLYGIYAYAAGFRALDFPSFRVYHDPADLRTYPPQSLRAMGVRLIHPIKSHANYLDQYQAGHLEDIKRYGDE